MKKIYLTKSILFSTLILFLLPFAGCEYLEFEENSNLTRPDVDATNSGVSVRLTKISTDTQYINIYRKDITEKNNPSELNIGILFPKQMNEADQTYHFEDLYMYKNHKYQYRARIFEADNTYYWTSYSDEITPSTGLEDNNAGTPLTLKYTNAGGAQVDYIQNKRRIRLFNGASDDQLTAPSAITTFDADGFKPALVLEIEATKMRQFFPLESLSEERFFQELLSEDFYNKKLICKGIGGIKLETTEDNEVIKAYFTDVTPLDVYIWKTPTDPDPKKQEDQSFEIKTSAVTRGFDASF